MEDETISGLRPNLSPCFFKIEEGKGENDFLLTGLNLASHPFGCLGSRKFFVVHYSLHQDGASNFKADSPTLGLKRPSFQDLPFRLGELDAESILPLLSPQAYCSDLFSPFRKEEDRD